MRAGVRRLQRRSSGWLRTFAYQHDGLRRLQPRLRAGRRREFVRGRPMPTRGVQHRLRRLQRQRRGRLRNSAQHLAQLRRMRQRVCARYSVHERALRLRERCRLRRRLVVLRRLVRKHTNLVLRVAVPPGLRRSSEPSALRWLRDGLSALVLFELSACRRLLSIQTSQPVAENASDSQELAHGTRASTRRITAARCGGVYDCVRRSSTGGPLTVVLTSALAPWRGAKCVA